MTKINAAQTYILLSFSISSFLQTTSVNPILSVGGRDAWIAVALSIVPFIAFALIVYTTYDARTSLLVESKRQVGGVVTAIFKMLSLLYLATNAFIDCRDIVTWTKIVLLPFTPKIIVILALVGLAMYLGVKGIGPIGIVATVVFIPVFCAIVFQNLFAMKYVHYSFLRPIGTTPFPSLLEGMWDTWRGEGNIALLLFLSHHTDGAVKRGRLVWTCITLGVLATMIAATLLATFGPVEAARLSFPIYNEVRLIQITEYIEKMDFISVFIWMTFTVVNASVMLFLIGDVIKPQSKLPVLLMGVLLIAALAIPWGELSYLTVLSEYYIPYSAWLVTAIILYAWAIRAKKKVFS
ncbi:GerAB/ArcD/ProY family transporter [Paenibacillus sp. CF384]|uniref:GerAB/ArcD/ProY family transporter n=1 Tax=Paenibacillus sp. CF384 TaxID=1884382 RepID=UPI00089B8D7B|nr:GerAB/ArcD/ProY family transporter [Paenibacillus sp. CF384]SDX11740.1 spore germination protein (amino acid permease) [Paenibacillus sp. CF384]